MKIFCLSPVAVLATLVAGSSALQNAGTTSGMHSSIDQHYEDQVTQTTDILAGLSAETTSLDDALAPAAPTDHLPYPFPIYGPRDTCLIDCGGDFMKSFVCWYYNNTRCFSCNLSSDDQWCQGNCACAQISSTPVAGGAAETGDPLGTHFFTPSGVFGHPTSTPIPNRETVPQPRQDAAGVPGGGDDSPYRC
ncbi:hypothetical protein BX600DRAFT_529656 [Xylariales sp. PMI_506]|nr:hypothetical protein BX600DRAFT_529656 [Xylariales sp. PMI_506]